MRRLWKTAHSVAINQESKLFTGWNVIYKNATKYTLYTRKVESRQGPPAKTEKLDEVLAAHCRANLVTECMKKKKTLILSGDFRFRFRPKMNVHFRFRFVFGRKWNSFSSAFSFTAENKKMFFGRPLAYITKRSWSWSLSWNAKSWSWSWTLGLVLVLVLKEF